MPEKHYYGVPSKDDIHYRYLWEELKAGYKSAMQASVRGNKLDWVDWAEGLLARMRQAEATEFRDA